MILDFYMMQQFYTLLTYGQMSCFTVPPEAFEFQATTGSGPSLEDLTDGMQLIRVDYNHQTLPSRVLSRSGI
jgi:hypothetical protein